MRMISMIVASLLMFNLFASTTGAHANKIELALYYKPGGGSDRHSSILSKSLEQQGVTVVKKFFKTCVEALDYVENNNNAYLFGIATDLRPNPSGKCPGLNSYNDVKLYSTIGDMSTMFCTTPKQNTIDWEKLQTATDPIKVGNVTADANWIPFQMFLDHSKNKINVKVIPYKGAGEVKRAAAAGNIDMMFIAGISAQMVQQGAKCLASSARDNWADAPFLGDFTTKIDFPETGLQTAIYSNGAVPEQIDRALRLALGSDQFNNDIHINKLRHTGLGAGRTAEAQWSELLTVFELYENSK